MTAIKYDIKAVKNLSRMEQEAWWDEIASDRLARSALFGFRPEQRTLESWAGMAAWPGHDLNVVYRVADGARLGYFWTCDRMGRGAFFHFNFLTAGYRDRVAIARYVFDVLYVAGYRVLAGMTPVFMRHVLSFIREVGGEIVPGIWPEVCYVADGNQWVDGVLSRFELPLLKGGAETHDTNIMED
jgi:hypothetical protein